MQNAALLEKSSWILTEKLPQDGGLRSYARVEKDGRKALYMDCGPLDAPGHVTRLSDFITIADWLRTLGLRTPEIYELDTLANTAIIEDFGRISLKQAMLDGADAMRLYKDAAEILRIIQEADCPLKLPNFEDSFMRKARQRFVDWYVPVMRGKANAPSMVAEYHALWNDIERGIGAYEQSFMHVDFHVENLMYLGGSGTGSIGIIDFQEGMIGPEAYDLSNLIGDMRADVPPEIQAELLRGKDENYLHWCRVLGTQFHCRLLGQILRWAFVENKTQYMQYYPRLIGYVDSALHDPVLRPFKDWLDGYGIVLKDASKLDWESCREFIAPDAV